MIRLVAARAAFHASLLLGVVLATFVLFQVIPTDPARVILGPNASEAQVVALRHELGLDRPRAVQALTFLGRISRLDFGRSFVDNRLVADEVRARLTISLALVSMTLVLTALYLIGVLTIERLGGFRVGLVTDFLLVSMPTMFAGVVVAVLAGRFWPFIAYSGRLVTVQDWLALVPGALALAFYPMAILSRILRGECDRLESEPFIVAARAQGFSETRILSSFMLKNASIPILAALSTLVPSLFTGAFIVEVIFSIPATGTLLVRAVLQRDFPMLEGIVIASAVIVISSHLVVEIASTILDPRIVSHRA